MMGFCQRRDDCCQLLVLMAPAIEMSEQNGDIAWLPAAVGFLFGGAFLWLVDVLLPHLHVGIPDGEPEGHKDLLAPKHIIGFGDHSAQFSGRSRGWRGLWRRSRRIARGYNSLCCCIGDWDWNPKLPGGFGCFCTFEKGRVIALEELFVWASIRNCGANRRCDGRCGCFFHSANFTYALSFAAGAMIYVVIEELIS
jgi:ZIP family zinc transporter